MKIEQLIRDANAFNHIFKLDGNIFVVNEFNNLTAFCVPSMRQRSGIIEINYELGFLVLTSGDNQELVFVNGIKSRRHLALPRTIGIENAPQSFVKNGRISAWMLSDMTDMMRRYTLARGDALVLIETEEDRFVESLKRVYREKFDDRILRPLELPELSPELP